MKRRSNLTKTARENGAPKQQRTTPRSDAGIEHNRDGGADTGTQLREAVRETEPPGAFDARAVRDLYKAVPTDPIGLRRTIRRSQLRQIIPLADSTIYELERRGEFPQRFFLTPRCVVWNVAEVLACLQSRRQIIQRG
jgi:prophage regulatory protein